MKRLLYVFLFSIQLCSHSALADTFYVTTTNPTGPGSLGEALNNAAANGDRVTDYILFNISRARDYFIRVPLGGLLPALSSNLVIDGTSQPGSVFGVTDARIGISLEGFYSGSDMLYALDGRGTKDVKIYGLFLKGNVIDRATLLPPAQLYGILMGGSSNYQIGAPSKGNLISGWSKAIYDMSNNRWGASSRITIQSNIFGLDIDGASTNYQDRTGGTATNLASIIFEKSSSNNLIGGTSANEGNIFNSSAIDIILQGVLMNDGLVTISYNEFGLDVNGNNIAGSSAAAIQVFDINTFPGNPFLPATPVISNNYIAGKSRVAGIRVMNVKTNFLIENNIMGYEDRAGFPARDANYGVAISIRNSEQSMIRNNIIRYWKSGAVILDTTYSATITNNSTYCNRKRAIELNHWSVMNPPQRPFPFIYINTIAGLRSNISGTSVPRSKVELFYNDPCPNCEGKTRFATVPVDLNGNWQYSGPITGDNIVATSTDVAGATSEYSVPTIDTSILSITPVACVGSMGSICGLKILSGTNWHWEDQSGNIIGTDTCLFNIPAGKYFLKLSIGSSCEESFSFQVPDVTPLIDASNVSITPSRCNGANGKICGLRAKNAITYKWEDEAGIVYANTICFANAPPGKYRLRVTGILNCEVVSSFYEVTNISPKIDTSNIQLIHPSCGRNNGSIIGMRISGNDYSIMSWFDENGRKITGNISLSNAAPGRYKFILRDTSAGCADSTSLYTLNMTPSLQLDSANAQLIHATCGKSNGSINGLSIVNGQGTVNFAWTNARGEVVGNSLDLPNIPAGNYTLKIKDASNCDTLTAGKFTILDNGSINIDSSSVTIIPSGCTIYNGSIKGIKLSGATSIEWKDLSNNAVVSTDLDLTNVRSGFYQLNAVNSAYGCAVTSSVYRVGTTLPTYIQLQAENILDASCGENNGSIQLTVTNASAFRFQWLKDSVADWGSTLTINNLAPAIYYCIATDENGCTQNFYKRQIAALPLPTIDDRNLIIRNDTCSLNTGSITGLKPIPDQPGMSFAWLDENGTQVANQLVLRQLKAGMYRLNLTDSRGCSFTSKPYTIGSISLQLSSPSYNSTSIDIARNADVTLKVQNGRLGNYELIDASTGALIQQNNSGNFIIPRVGNDLTVQVRYSAGSCSSTPVSITIKVFDDTRLTIPNAFSPNNDGINDVFRITAQGYFRLSYLKIFNRWGQLVFESHDLNLGWDGRRNGTDLPTGVYYWVLSGIDVHNLALTRNGSITLIR